MYIFQPPEWFLRWACPQLTPTFWRSDICELWYPLGFFFVCVEENLCECINRWKNIQHSLPWTFLFFFPLDLCCVNKSQWFIRSLPPIYPLAEYVNDWARPGQPSAVYRATTIFVSVCVGCFCVFPNRAMIRFSLWNNRPSALAAAGVYPFITKASCISFQELWMERRRRKKN